MPQVDICSEQVGRYALCPKGPTGNSDCVEATDDSDIKVYVPSEISDSPGITHRKIMEAARKVLAPRPPLRRACAQAGKAFSGEGAECLAMLNLSMLRHLAFRDARTLRARYFPRYRIAWDASPSEQIGGEPSRFPQSAAQTTWRNSSDLAGSSAPPAPLCHQKWYRPLLGSAETTPRLEGRN